jgi:hypothetical protein
MAIWSVVGGVSNATLRKVANMTPVPISIMKAIKNKAITSAKYGVCATRDRFAKKTLAATVKPAKGAIIAA